jgi:hypothetical protein
LEIDRKTIHNLSEYRQAIATLKKGASLLLLVQRGQTAFFVALRTPKETPPS